jgi:hypothetical protein
MNPMDEIKKLRDAIDNALSDLDLERVTFTMIPGENGQQDSVGMIFKISPRAFLTAEQKDIDSTFDDLISGLVDDPDQDRLNEVKNMISDWMDDEGSASE